MTDTPIATLSDTPSPPLAQLFEALAKAQAEIKAALKDSANPFFKTTYADLASVWDACRAPLSKNGLCIIQTTDSDDPQVVCVTTILGHSSGAFITSSLRMYPQKNDPQSIGTCITYGRRYGLSAMVGIAAEDDDGGQASDDKGDKQPVLITIKQAEDLQTLIDKTGADAVAFCEFFHIKQVGELPAKDFKRATAMLNAKKPVSKPAGEPEKAQP
jgi:hypothetical protein